MPTITYDGGRIEWAVPTYKEQAERRLKEEMMATLEAQDAATQKAEEEQAQADALNTRFGLSYDVSEADPPKELLESFPAPLQTKIAEVRDGWGSLNLYDRLQARQDVSEAIKANAAEKIRAEAREFQASWDELHPQEAAARETARSLSQRWQSLPPWTKLQAAHQAGLVFDSKGIDGFPERQKFFSSSQLVELDDLVVRAERASDGPGTIQVGDEHYLLRSKATA
jgi:hypothetical protein